MLYLIKSERGVFPVLKANKNISFVLKNIGLTLLIPVLVFICMHIFCKITAGIGLLAYTVDFKNLARTWVYSFSFSLAVALNFFNGRFDFSMGAQVLFGTIIGGNLGKMISQSTGINVGICIIVCAVLVGLAAGLLIGVIFTKMRILPMVYGLGIAMILECIGFASFNSNGLTLFGVAGAELLSELWFIGVVFLIVILLMSYAFNYTKFGYEWRAIQGNQNVAANSGINIFRNCIICYFIAGGLAGVSGVFNAAYSGTILPVLGLSTISTVTGNLFALFLGVFIGQWSNMVVGIFCSSLSVQLITLGLAKSGLSSSTQTVIVYAIFVSFLVFKEQYANVGVKKEKKARTALARQRRAELELQRVL